MEKLKARETIERGDWDTKDYRAVFDLYLLAYDDPELAQRAQTKFLETKVRESCQAAMRGQPVGA